MQNFYLEISPRGAGKTWFLAHDVARHLLSNEDNVAVIFTVSQRHFNFITDRVKELLKVNFSKRLVRFKDIKDIAPMRGIKYYFDDFEWLDQLTVENVEQIVKANVYFVSSVCKVRNVEDFNSKTDVLAKLLELNNYYHSSRIVYGSKFHYSTFLSEIKENLTDDQFKAEILNQFIK